MDIPVTNDVQKLVEKGEYEKAKRRYRSWRNKTLESKMYICVLFALCKGCCPSCGADMILTFQNSNLPNVATLDHIDPISATKEHNKLGLQIMCKDCNSRKGDSIETKGSKFTLLDLAKVSQLVEKEI